MGRRASWEGIDDLADDNAECCSKGVKVAYSLNDEPDVYCKVEKCCDGLVERSFFSPAGKAGLVLVSECSEPQDIAFGSSRGSSDS
ncbi:hypothetical protein FSP39_009440 [Pinctada imbricata]|uniref:Uncharacterized protein n=1 Tax=Pinctada imbricata TaxID=66713 RepID=A0AA88YLU7_PINIB|nr:hypothetical protein FSP39_009440 [Pinctada imbricata]